MKYTLLTPEVCRSKFNTSIDMSAYRYESPRGDVLSIGTHAAEHSERMSLGGFRIVPAARAALPGFLPERESIELGIGMEEKVYWSKLFKIAGPKSFPQLSKVVGGKCVLLPATNGRVGESNDIETLSWAVDCLMDFEKSTGIRVVTGQDLGHGNLSTGESSLSFMSKRFRGVIITDTSKPTGEGNYQLMRGFAEAANLSWKQLHFGILGCGNIGEHIVARLKEDGATMTALEPRESTRQNLSRIGVTALDSSEKERFLKLPLDIIAVNALGGTLDTKTCELIAANSQTKLVSGSENLVMGNPNDSEILRLAKKLYVHTELCGMMGYVTAVETYLCKESGSPFEMTTMFQTAAGLKTVGERVAKQVLAENFNRSFEDVARELYR